MSLVRHGPRQGRDVHVEDEEPPEEAQGLAVLQGLVAGTGLADARVPSRVLTPAPQQPHLGPNLRPAHGLGERRGDLEELGVPPDQQVDVV